VSEKLAGLAEARGLSVVARLLRSFPVPDLLERDIPDDARLSAAPGARIDEALSLMVRRGHAPELVRRLLDHFADRPLERGLVAWDTLSRCLLAEGDPLAAELRAALSPITPALPDDGRAIDLNTWPADGLIARFSHFAARRSDPEPLLLERVIDHDLAALCELHRRGDQLVKRSGALDGLRAWAGVLHLARLPGLASVYLDFITRRGRRAAAMDLCEVLFDAESPERIPGDAIQQGDLPPVELAEAAEYVTYRSWIALGRFRHAHDLLRENQQKRSKGAPARSPRMVGVEAHLTTLAGEKTISLSRVARICEKDRLWRYGQRVRVLATAAQSPPDSPAPLERLHEFVTAFGNDLRCWVEALTMAPREAGWRKESLRLLGREARALPHEPALWRVLLMFSGDAELIERGNEEIDARLRAQRALG
jgi:hypothetical protein